MSYKRKMMELEVKKERSHANVEVSSVLGKHRPAHE